MIIKEDENSRLRISCFNPHVSYNITHLISLDSIKQICTHFLISGLLHD